MKKALSIILTVILVFSLCACGEKEDVKPMEPTEEESTEIVLRDISLDSEEGQAVKNAVSTFLDVFISADMEQIAAQLHPDDLQFFNFESEEQVSLYKAIFSQLKYEFHSVAEHKGVYGIMTTITSPDMADVYGTIITERIDQSIENTADDQDARAKNTKRMLELLNSGELPERVEKLYIYVEYIDGEYIPRCDMYLANELIGGAAEASDMISSTLNETIDYLGGEE